MPQKEKQVTMESKSKIPLVMADASPYLIPIAPDLSSLKVPKSWTLSKSERKKCGPITSPSDKSTKRQQVLAIPIAAAETVIYLYSKSLDESDSITNSLEYNLAKCSSVSRGSRALIVTPGSLQFKAGGKGIMGLFGKDRKSETIKFALLGLRSVHISENSVVVMAYEDYEEQMVISDAFRYIMFQTPDAQRWLTPLVSMIVAANVGVPQWAIPITWSGSLPDLPPISTREYQNWMGLDGGLSSSLYSSILAYSLWHKVPYSKTVQSNGRAIIEHFIVQQQEPENGLMPARNQKIHSLNLLELVRHLNDKRKDLFAILVHQALRALSFNLVFRKLQLLNYLQTPAATPAFGESLAQLLLYNVTLRELDLSHTSLEGLGESIGKSLAMNAQPLLSKIILADCGLSGRDLRGLLPGLARIWCGGTSLLEFLSMANNPGIPEATWDVFFIGFADPSTLPFWPGVPPPPPNLGYLQDLNLLDTKAVGHGFLRFIRKCTGLRSLSFSAHDDAEICKNVLRALTESECQIEHLKIKNCQEDYLSPIMNLKFTLRSLNIVGFSGDVGQLVCGWSQMVPNLRVTLQGGLEHARVVAPVNTEGFCPSALTVVNETKFISSLVQVLSYHSSGLKELILEGICYSELADCAPVLAHGGLAKLQIEPPKKASTPGSGHAQFWNVLATSRSLHELSLPNQILGPPEISMIGQFLKTNRSVQRIMFDSKKGFLDVDSTKVLRSAFFGNKKVLELQYPKQCLKNTSERFKKETQALLQEVSKNKKNIKRIFKQHYSKYDGNWRAKPNQLKLPYVENIRVAKRKIGKIERESKKIAELLQEIKGAVDKNVREFGEAKQEKDVIKISRRQTQLQGLAEKKKKLVSTLISKLHKAKGRGRRNKAAKTQASRATYYQSPEMWPPRQRRRRRVHSRYRHFNDPYGVRFYPYCGYYDDVVQREREEYLNSEGDVSPVGAAFNEERAGATMDETTPGGIQDSGSLFLGSTLADIHLVGATQEDPWEALDALVASNPEAIYENISSSSYLAAIHQEASELGPDVVADIAPILDRGAAVDKKMTEIADSSNIAREQLDYQVNSSLDPAMDMAVITSTLESLPDFQMEQEVDNVADLYAGAGPRDLDDGGPNIGYNNLAALSGARRKARSRKAHRTSRRLLSQPRIKEARGYSILRFDQERNPSKNRKEETVWPDNLVERWQKEIRMQQIRAFSEKEIFPLPDVSKKEPQLWMQWNETRESPKTHLGGIEVALVTQCSLDRLPNLQAQLLGWQGCASVALYLRYEDDRFEAMETVKVALEDVRSKMSQDSEFDLVLSVVHGSMEDEEYPINYLRNIALLQAKQQQLRRHGSLESCGVLLVDVDFRPSADLHAALHCRNAAHAVLQRRQVVVCAAFESLQDSTFLPHTLQDLEQAVQDSLAEGFHHSHFPQGHGPSNFGKYFQQSRLWAMENEAPSSCWDRLYAVSYKASFEPYVVMASADVPLYDERFQGYGLNKVSHLASVAKQVGNTFHVLPGVFLVAAAHDKSESWKQRYGRTSSCLSDETRYNQLCLKGLYCNFQRRLDAGFGPVVSNRVRLQDTSIRLHESIHRTQGKPPRKQESSYSMGSTLSQPRLC